MAQLLRGALEAEGVPAVIEGEHLAPLAGALPAGVSAELRVSVLDDAQFAPAEEFVAAWLEQRQARLTSGPWRCQSCGEEHEPQFSACWKCGASAAR